MQLACVCATKATASWSGLFLRLCGLWNSDSVTAMCGSCWSYNLFSHRVPLWSGAVLKRAEIPTSKKVLQCRCWMLLNQTRASNSQHVRSAELFMRWRGGRRCFWTGFRTARIAGVGREELWMHPGVLRGGGVPWFWKCAGFFLVFICILHRDFRASGLEIIYGVR